MDGRGQTHMYEGVVIGHQRGGDRRRWQNGGQGYKGGNFKNILNFPWDAQGIGWLATVLQIHMDAGRYIGLFRCSVKGVLARVCGRRDRYL